MTDISKEKCIFIYCVRTCIRNLCIFNSVTFSSAFFFSTINFNLEFYTSFCALSIYSNYEYSINSMKRDGQILRKIQILVYFAYYFLLFLYK